MRHYFSLTTVCKEHTVSRDRVMAEASSSQRSARKRVAIVQSNYVPWKGYFDLIDRVDEFIILDTVQYTKRDWRNRNTIKTENGLRWLSIPVKVRGRYKQRIDETEIASPGWAMDHWNTLQREYSKCSGFDEVGPTVQSLYETATQQLLTDVNRHFINGLCELLGITTPIRSSGEFDLAEDKTERLVSLCIHVGATEYVSGPAARAYLDASAFSSHNIDVSWFDYNGYPEYEQKHGTFCHNVSVLDVLFNKGRTAMSWIHRRNEN